MRENKSIPNDLSRDTRLLCDELTQEAERLGLYPDEDACDELRSRIEETSQITVRTAKSAKYREK